MHAWTGRVGKTFEFAEGGEEMTVRARILLFAAASIAAAQSSTAVTDANTGIDPTVLPIRAVVNAAYFDFNFRCQN